MALRRRCLLWKGLGLAGLVLAAGPAHAQVGNFNIPAQPASSAIVEFGRQAGVQILAEASAVQSQMTPGVSGRFEVMEALRRMLVGTELKVASSRGDVIILTRDPAIGRNAAPGATPVEIRPPAQRPPRLPDAAPDEIQSEIEGLVVSASRIVSGYQQPTPVTVVGLQQIEQEAKLDIGDALRDTPQVSGGAPQAGSNANVIAGLNPGASTLMLRGLGVTRTLVLVDGQRMIASHITGGVDVNAIPSTLVSRVDVVTAGASSAWGSDAVAGVINFVLDRNFTGFKGNVEASTSQGGLYPSYKAEAAFGADVADGRGHLILSGSHTAAPRTVYLGATAWNRNGVFVVPNPAVASNGGGPRFVTIHNAGLATATPGGLIVSNPAGSLPGSADLLRGLQFRGPNADVSRYDFGTIAGILSYGGSGGFWDNLNPYRAIAVPYRADILFAYYRQALTPTVRASLQLNYADSVARNASGTAANFGNLTISADNPYIPPAVRAVMAANGIPSFVMGTLNSNNVALNSSLSDLSLSSLARSLGFPVQRSSRQLRRAVLTLDGSVGQGWAWNAYAQAAQVDADQLVINNTLRSRLALAQDAVRITADNVGASGLPLGSIQCRVRLSDPSSACAPLNVFGEGVASREATAWINSSDALDFQNVTLRQRVAAASASGPLPFSLPAGPIAAALGFEYRREQADIVADPRGANTEWAQGNFANFHGAYQVREAFVELEAPVLKDRLIRSLVLNGAGRLTHYSASGGVQTWKLGAVAQLDDRVGLRGTVSRDIRAPNLNELFAAHSINVAIQTDPRTGQAVNAFNDTSGNPDLKPEVGRTVTAGVLLQSASAQGLRASVDWYRIKVTGAIVTPTSVSVTAQCALGVQLYCNQLEFSGPNGALSIVHTRPINSAFASVEGIDAQLDYRRPLGAGALTVQVVGNYVIDSVATTLGVACSTAGTAGLNAPNCGGGPRLTSNLTVTYDHAPWSLTARIRYQSPYKLNTAWVEGVDIDDNRIPSDTYLDLRAAKTVGRHARLYLAVDNVLNASPLVIPAFYNQGNAHAQTFGSGDLLGRVVRAGLRFTY